MGGARCGLCGRLVDPRTRGSGLCGSPSGGPQEAGGERRRPPRRSGSWTGPWAALGAAGACAPRKRAGQQDRLMRRTVPDTDERSQSGAAPENSVATCSPQVDIAFSPRSMHWTVRGPGPYIASEPRIAWPPWLVSGRPRTAHRGDSEYPNQLPDLIAKVLIAEGFAA